MRTVIFFLIFTLSACSIEAEEEKPAEDKAGPQKNSEKSGPPPAPEGMKWQKNHALSDEFNSNQINNDRWFKFHPYWKGRDSRFKKENVYVKNGYMHLKSSLSQGAKKVDSSTVTAACLSSKRPIASYGYYEARIKASDLSMTTAFWFQGSYSEIDVIENIGRPTNEKSRWIEDTMMMNTHYFKGGWKKDITTPAKWKMPAHARDKFHVYGLWWKDADTVWFYHDGVKVAEVKTGGPFKELLYMFFDTEVFHWHGWPTKESLLDPNKNTMKVDWIRSWSLIDVE